MNVLPTSTSAQFLLSIFVLMYTDSARNGLLSPANISVLHCRSFRPSVRSCLLQAVNHGKKSQKQHICADSNSSCIKEFSNNFRELHKQITKI